MTQINLSSLDYSDIRQSLVNYLKKQDVVRDLNFEGSAVNFLLDLLAYNTLFYAHYANMIGNEAFLDSAQLEKTLVSLVKPLGYVIPTKTSSSANIRLTGVSEAGPLLPYTISVVGTTPEGVQYSFWNIDSIEINDLAQTDPFLVYQGNYTSLSYGGNGFDFPNQEIFIPDLSMDIRTLRVGVKTPPSIEYKIWQRYDLYSGYSVTNDSELYTLERTSSGFKIKFGNSVGKKLISGDIVKIEYLSSSGSLTNNCSSFKASVIPSNSSVFTISPSSGGLDQANLDDVKTNAPLSFAAQQRLVTAGDYVSYMNSLGYNNIKVWGGETNSPPIYGRVFISRPPVTPFVLNSILKKLRNRSLITVIPEYVTPITTKVLYPLRLIYDPTITTNSQTYVNKIKTSIFEKYPTDTFDLIFTKSNISNIVQSQPGYALNDQNWYIKLQQSFLPTTSNVVLNFKTEINRYNLNLDPPQIVIGQGVESKTFTSPLFPNENVFIRDVPIIFTNGINAPKIGTLELYKKESSGVINPLNYKVGKIDYSTGILTLNGGISTTEVEVMVKPTDQEKYMGIDEIYVYPEIEIEEVIAL